MNLSNFELTPLGAAIVEAMPNRKKKSAIQRQFDKYKICPASLIFTEKQVVDWYAARGENVTSVSASVKSSAR